MKYKYLVGIDEAGRGPLAGPVAVGVFVIKYNSKPSILKHVKDSKKCSQQLREELFEEIVASDKLKVARYAVGFSSANYIDKYGIVPAIKIAMEKVLGKLEKELKFKPSECRVMLDGSLRAPDRFINQQTIIKGDALVPVISAASICAKVMRDNYMKRVAKKFHDYKFEVHKGYGTKLHRTLITKHGPSKEHRKTFLKNLL